MVDEIEKILDKNLENLFFYLKVLTIETRRLISEQYIVKQEEAYTGSQKRI